MSTNNDLQLWERYCNFIQHYPEVGLSLDVSRIRFEDSLFDVMSEGTTRAFSEMKELEKGAIANPDEKRMVGHYWLRAPELAPNDELRNAIVETNARITAFVKDIHSGKIAPEKADAFRHVLLVGIGGSALGPQLVADAMWTAGDKMQIHFFDNTDPDGMQRTITQLGSSLKETLAVVISKSGGTPETRNGQLEIADAFQRAGLNFGKHAVAVTSEGSKLDNRAAEEGWLDRFPMWDWVGGRTSLFSAVGLVPAMLQGVDTEAFIAGARAMDEVTRKEVARENPAMLLALMWYVAGGGKGAKDMVVLPYKDRLMLFSKYLQQLIMESLGKADDLDGTKVEQGIAVYGNKGSTDQHAYVQQLRDGVNNFFATFIEVLRDDTDATPPSSPAVEVEPGITSGDFLSGFLQGTRKALYENNRDSITITLDELNATRIGSLIALYERAVSFYASLVRINAYHQPGVEAGKKAAAKVIDLQNDVSARLKSEGPGKSFTADELAQAIGAENDVETIYKVLAHLAANPSRGIAQTGSGDPRSVRFSLS